MSEPNAGLWAELKRRRVVRVGLVYVIAAVAVVEAADVMLPRLALPEWTVTLVVALAVLGFPVAVALAWAFDVTPAGMQRSTGPAAADSTPAGPFRFHWTAGRIAVVASVVILAVAGGGWFLGRGERVLELDADAVAVLPFRVSGADPSLGYLREGVVDLLAAKLTGEAGPRAVHPRTMLAAWRRSVGPESEAADMNVAQQLARQLGAGKLLMGDVVGTSSALTVRAELVDVSTGRTTEAQQSGPAEGLTVIIDRLAATLLALEAGEDQRRLAQLTTTSLPALRAYLQGQADYRRARFSEAADHFERAVTEDSTFALAAMGLGQALGWFPQRPGGAAAYELAWTHRERLSPRDRRHLTALVGPNHPAPHSRAEELTAFRAALNASPDDPEMWYRVGDILYHSGAQLGMEDALDRATRHFQRALDLDPDFGPVAEHLFAAHLRGGASEEAVEIGLHYLRLGGDAAGAVRWFLPRIDGGDSIAAPGLREMEPEGLRRVAAWSRDGGFFVDSGEVAARLSLERIRERGTPFQVRNAVVGFTVWEFRRGRPEAAVTMFGDSLAALPVLLNPLVDPAVAELAAAALERRVEAAGDDPDALWTSVILAQRAARKGNAASARSLIERLEADSFDDPGLTGTARFARLLLSAELAVIEDAPDAAERVAALDSAALTVPEIGTFLELGNASLIGLHEALGNREAALAASRRRAFTVGSTIYLAEMLREEGRLAALLGRRDQAIDAYRTYLAFRGEPEPAIAAEVERVRADLQRLLGDR